MLNLAYVGGITDLIEDSIIPISCVSFFGLLGQDQNSPLEILIHIHDVI
jgi:hypothetical protein